ncbi:MAG: glycogen synthase [Chlamydiales bacterium]
MHIFHIATELAPIAKVGGLSDVLYGLSKELVRQGHKVEILIPKYDSIDYSQLKHLKVEMREVPCIEGTHQIQNTVWSAELDGLRVLLLEPHHPHYYFNRGKIYGCGDDIERFTYFCKAALEYLIKAKAQPDILHLHDWPTALVAPLCKEVYEPLGLKPEGIVLTIHNLEYQSKCLPQQLIRIGLHGDTPEMREKLEDLIVKGTINLLKGGIEYADFVTTVSPAYEKEIKTPHGGSGLDTVLLKYETKLKGILNGIDEAFWDPEKDPLLVRRYKTHGLHSLDQLQDVHEGKKENRNHVRMHFGLKEENSPLVCSVTRLSQQKGPELILYALNRSVKKGGQFVLLGSDHGSKTEQDFLALHGLEQKVGICIDRDEALAHLIFAAADMIVIPSYYEPCGLTQMIALRYGTVPLVRRTGGLADTIFDIDTATVPEELRNGFNFDFYDTGGIDWVLDRAFTCWANDRKKWEMIMFNGMQQDFTWKNPTAAYLEIYTSLTQKKTKVA